MRCLGGFPCRRCMQRGTPCMPNRVGGKGWAARKRGFPAAAAAAAPRKKARAGRKSVELLSVEDSVAQEIVKSRTSHSLRWLICHWFALGTARRSTMLLSKAFGLAAKMGLSLDDMMGTGGGGETEVLRMSEEEDSEKYALPSPASAFPSAAASPSPSPSLSSPTAISGSMAVYVQRLRKPLPPKDRVGPRMPFSKLPHHVTKKIKANGAEDTLNERWVIVRHDIRGKVEFHVSEAFERDICSFHRIRNTFLANQTSVMSLWTPPDKMRVVDNMHGRCLARLLSQISSPTRAPAQCVYSCVPLQTKIPGEGPIDAFRETWARFFNVDEAWIVHEYRRTPFSRQVSIERPRKGRRREGRRGTSSRSVIAEAGSAADSDLCGDGGIGGGWDITDDMHWRQGFADVAVGDSFDELEEDDELISFISEALC